jgi:peptidyl-prolyl cis-trans isomerase SurA
MIRDLYDRTTKEVNASHILLTVDKNATPEEEQKVLDKINQIREEIINGKDFGEAAVEYSQDPSAKKNMGSLGYFTAFQMVVPFENAAFSTPVGEISQPVRSSFGYHLIYVQDIRKNRGEIKVAHIMKMFPQNVTPEIKAKLKVEIDSIYQELLKGADFGEMAKTKSDDKRSAEQNGEMPFFAAGRMIPEFANPAFDLKNKGDYTAPVETPYGFHIIKKLDVREVPVFEESKANLEAQIKRDPQRSVTSKHAFTEKLKSQYHFTENKEGKNKLWDKNIADTLDVSDFELFNIDNKSYGLKQFQAYLKKQNPANTSYLANYDSWVEDEITQLEDSKLEEKYPDFRYLMQEYHDGILLFNISEEKIWNFAAQDSAGLEAFYNKNNKKYLWEERFKGLVVTGKTVEAREEAEKYLAEDMPVEEIEELMNKDENRVTIKEGAWEKGSNPVVDYFVWNESQPETLNPELTFIRGDKIPPEPKTLNEARGLYVSDYQKQIEENWLKELRKKYKIKVNKKLLKTIEGV